MRRLEDVDAVADELGKRRDGGGKDEETPGEEPAFSEYVESGVEESESRSDAGICVDCGWD